MDINELRKKIDGIDDRLLPLFLERMELASQIAKCKRETGAPTADPAREREILAKVEEKSGGLGLYSHRLYKTVFGLSRAYQSSLSEPSGVGADIAASFTDGLFPQSGNVACAGTEGAYAGLAAERFLPRGNVIWVNSFDAVFGAVKSGLCAYGVLPLENSSNGSVKRVFELLAENGAGLIACAKMHIKHELLAKPGTALSDITEVYSHEQALGQCSKFLSGLGKNVRLIPCASTADAAKKVAGSDGRCAAISSRACAEIYSLESLCSDISDSDNNYTRFILIAADKKIYPGADRVSMILTLPHKPGALYEMLSVPAALGVNLLKLESYPKVGSDFEFTFYVELQGDVRDKNVSAMLRDMQTAADSFVFLGAFREL